MTDDRLTNVDAEASLLGALMQDNDLIDQVGDRVSSQDFSEGVHQRLFEVICHRRALGKPANPVTIKGHFDGDQALKELGGMAYLAGLTANSYGRMVAYDLADQLADLSVRRTMREKLRLAAEDCFNLDIATAEVVSRADAALVQKGADVVSQAAAWECIGELVKSYDEKSLGVTCGMIPTFDDLLGPMSPKQLIIGAGRPGMGKTALAVSYALGAARRGHGVLFVSLEMSSRELAARMAADLCFSSDDPVPFACIRDGRLSEPQLRQLLAAQNRMSTLPLQVVDAGSLTTGRLSAIVRRHARRMAAQGVRLELVVVDYLQLLQPDQRARSAYESVSEVSRSLKVMAKDNALAIFALAQLSRDVERRADKKPQLSDLKDSGQIEQDADAVMFLLRDEYYLRQSEVAMTSPEFPKWEMAMNESKGRIEFILAKRRNGVTGVANGRFHGSYQAVR